MYSVCRKRNIRGQPLSKNFESDVPFSRTFDPTKLLLFAAKLTSHLNKKQVNFRLNSNISFPKNFNWQNTKIKFRKTSTPRYFTKTCTWWLADIKNSTKHLPKVVEISLEWMVTSANFMKTLLKKIKVSNEETTHTGKGKFS